MKKVFYRCMETDSTWWTVGKEYEADCYGGIDDAGDYYGLRELEIMISDGGRRPTGWSAGFQRIEREVFTAHGFEWFRHTPGEPMPCDGDDLIFTILSDMKIGDLGRPYRAEYATWHRELANPNAIIGWRYADSAQASGPEPVGDGVADDTAAIQSAIGNRRITGIIKRVCAEYSEDESERNDLIAAVEDSTLTPSQRRHWNEMEAKQAAREQLKHDAEAKALQDRAEQLSDAGKAMDRVNQDHGHRLGLSSWM